MGNGMCSRRQKRVLQALASLAVIIAFIYGALLNYDLQSQLKKAETVSLKYQQHQESLSAQLQVVYEHRSRLEKSLQKERLEHKKAKEDFLVYKLEAQETLNKGRQDSNNRYNALSVQHQMLKSQHDELRKRHSSLQVENQKLGEDLSKTFSDHKEKYLLLQQAKEQELSKLKEHVYNLGEENTQLRKAHQDVHTQLQDVKQQHKNLLSQHEQVVQSLDDHKSALAVAQNQVEEFKQLKDALNKMPSLRQPEKSTISTEPRFVQPGRTEGPVEKEAPVLHGDVQQTNDHQGAAYGHIDIQNRFVNQDVEKPETHKSEELAAPEQGPEPSTEHPVEVEEEHKKELEEEEMEQVGKPERLVEDQDQIQEEQEHQRQPDDEQREEENEEEQKEEDTNIVHEHNHAESDHTSKPEKYKSAYEEQLEQQQRAARQVEEARHLKEQQDLLHQQRLQDHFVRQQQRHEKDLELQRQNKYKEEQHAENIRRQAQYDNIDHDIVQGEEEQHLQEEGAAYEKDDHQDEAEDLDAGVNNAIDEQAVDQAESKEQEEKPVADDLNPADDPNNQGEDEFEEAEQEPEENLPDENEEQRQQAQGHPDSVQEHLVMADNPDQQEDNIDEQYQEEGEEEVQEDLTEEKRREHNAEEPYEENEENVVEKHIGAERERDAEQDHKERNEENYEEEEEEEDGAGGEKHNRAEM
ncbi:Golgi integral membrane protein 4 [Discoglossus pictus]